MADFLVVDLIGMAEGTLTEWLIHHPRGERIPGARERRCTEPDLLAQHSRSSSPRRLTALLRCLTSVMEVHRHEQVGMMKTTFLLEQLLMGPEDERAYDMIIEAIVRSPRFAASITSFEACDPGYGGQQERILAKEFERAIRFIAARRFPNLCKNSPNLEN